MKLRYLAVQDYPPISDLKVHFAAHTALKRRCGIRFVVGVNGSGKSNLLRALAEVFLALAEERLPPFKVSLVYELGDQQRGNHQTFLLDCPGREAEASLWVAKGDIASDLKPAALEQLIYKLRGAPRDVPAGFEPVIAKGFWPQRADIALPRAILVYSTGELRPWRSVWNRKQPAAIASDEPWFERPSGWTAALEAALPPEASITAQGNAGQLAQNSTGPGVDLFRRPVLVTPRLLKCALLAVALHHENSRGEQASARASERSERLMPLFAMGGWHYLVSASFRVSLQVKSWSRTTTTIAHDWLLCAGEVITEPHPTEQRRTLYFDVQGTFDGGYLELLKPPDGISDMRLQGEVLRALVGKRDDSAFELFRNLTELHQAGLFDDLDLRLRRNEKPMNLPGLASPEQDAGVLRLEELSDGEQMVLGRLALFHLLEGQDDSILLLDEPETHFNDLWKRDIVSVIDDALGATSCEVVIATHAALMLTDAVKDELLVLERDKSSSSSASKLAPGGTVIKHLDQGVHTFGATGDHPLRDVFGAQDTVGRRASRLLEVLIAAASLAPQMETFWSAPTKDGGRVNDSEVVNAVLKIALLTEPDLTFERVKDALSNIEHFALSFGAVVPLSMKAVLKVFVDQTGPGYFQLELKRAWYRLTKESGHVA